jgi:PhnB protein
MTARRRTTRRHATTTRKTAGTKGRAKRVATGTTAPVARTRPDGSGLAPGMHAVNTYLAVENVAASMDFLERAFGFSRGVVLAEPGGPPRYAEMRHGNSAVMLIRKGDQATATNGSPALYTYVEDVDRAAARAREAGAGVAEAEDKPWGDRVAMVTDPDGYRWMLATFKKLVPFA